jgi:hypothetical protein
MRNSVRGDMRTTQIGAQVVWSIDRRSVTVMPKEYFTIDRLESMARSLLVDDPEPFASAPAFVFETRYQRMADGTSERVEVKVHPDPRVQELLQNMREEQITAAVGDLQQQIGADIELNEIHGEVYDLKDFYDYVRGVSLAEMRERAAGEKRRTKNRAKDKAQRRARKRNRR